MAPGEQDAKKELDMLRKAAQLRAVSGRSKLEEVRKKGDVSDAKPQKVEPVKEEVSVKTYTVEPGDTLSGIALKLLGNANRWPDIFNANKDKIENPNLIYAGQELVIPD